MYLFKEQVTWKMHLPLLVTVSTHPLDNSGQVDIYTAHYDRQRCFEETRSGKFSVYVGGSWFPRSIFGRMMAVCAYIRCILAAIKLSFDSRRQQYDVIIVDQVSAVIPFLKALTSARILFYCHFPDLLLAQRRSTVHSIYRAPIDWIEQSTTGQADHILVNSEYTKRIFAETFSRLDRRGIIPSVLYPAVVIPNNAALTKSRSSWQKDLPEKAVTLLRGGPTFLSINRFERKKRIEIAIEALDLLIKDKKVSKKSPQIVIAGGYDPRLPENVEYLRDLGKLAARHGIRDSVAFLPSFSDSQKAALMAGCIGVIYTPPGEHFGIVPLEAMAAGRAVVACNSGGPRESIVDGETGYLCQPTAKSFASAMKSLMDESTAERLGAQAREHVQKKFSRNAFGKRLNDIVISLANQKSKIQ